VSTRVENDPSSGGLAEAAATSPSPRIRYLDARRLNLALRAGIDRIFAERAHLNRINVFPVPDGDTGTNLTLTAGSIGGVLLQNSDAHAGQLLITVADAALDGARGNSGAILAQFFQGLADALGERRSILAADLVQALETATEYARSALDAPKDGTVLSVIGDFSRQIATEHRQGLNDLVPLLDAGLRRARISLEATRHGLEAMRKAGVVDAGASGFVSLLEGMADFLHTGSLRAIPEPSMDDPDIAASVAASSPPEDVEFRYCTECMVTGDDIDRRKLREGLSALGNSLVMAGTHRKLKIHIHTNQPADAFSLAGRFGTVTGEKADDMRRQTTALGAGSPGIAVVTDSAADLPDEAFDSLGIHLVPLRINFGDQSYLDKLGLSVAEFFARLRTSEELPQTSQPAPGDFRRLYEFLVSHFDHVISVSLTSRVSGTWQAAVAAAARVSAAGRITVIDSRNVSLGQGLITMYAAECARAGYSVQDTVEAVRASRSRTITVGLVPDLSHAVRGGRIGQRTSWLANRFGVTPLIHVDAGGQVKVTGLLSGRGEAVHRLCRYLRRRTTSGRAYRLAIGHSDAPELAERLASSLIAEIPNVESSYVTEIGAALGVHAGPGTVAAALQEYHPV
jgi:DegV family protein with EDD domain